MGIWKNYSNLGSGSFQLSKLQIPLTIFYCYLRKEKRKKDKDSGRVIQELQIYSDVCACVSCYSLWVVVTKQAGLLSRALTSFPVIKCQKNRPPPLRQTAEKWCHLSKEEKHRQIIYHHVLIYHDKIEVYPLNFKYYKFPYFIHC